MSTGAPSSVSETDGGGDPWAAVAGTGPARPLAGKGYIPRHFAWHFRTLLGGIFVPLWVALLLRSPLVEGWFS